MHKNVKKGKSKKVNITIEELRETCHVQVQSNFL